MILPKLNISGKPIANKYCEGKMKRTLKRELKVPETAAGEANGTSSVQWEVQSTRYVSFDTVRLRVGFARDSSTLSLYNLTISCAPSTGM